MAVFSGDAGAEKITLTSGRTVPLFSVPSAPVQLREYLRSGLFRGEESGFSAAAGMLAAAAGVPSLAVSIDSGLSVQEILLYHVPHRNVWIPGGALPLEEDIRYRVSFRMPGLERRQEFIVSGHALELMLKYGLHSSELRTILMSGDPLTVEVLCGNRTDTDGDGLHDAEERLRGTLPDDADSDADGFSDLAEVELGTDPLRADAKGLTVDGFSFDFLKAKSIQIFNDPEGDVEQGFPDAGQLRFSLYGDSMRMCVSGGALAFAEAPMHEVSVVCYGGREIWAFRFYRQPGSRFLRQEVQLIRGGKIEIQPFNADVLASARRDFECSIPLYMAGKANPAMIVYKIWSADGRMVERAEARTVRTIP